MNEVTRVATPTVQANPQNNTVSVEISEEDLKALELEQQMAQAAKVEKVDEFKKTVEETTKSSKSELISTLVQAAMFGMAAIKLAPIARRSFAKLGEPLAKAMVNVAEKLAQKFPKISFDGAKAKEIIEKVAKELKEGNSTKIVDFFKKHIGEILGKETKINTIPIISTIKSDVGIIDAAIATGVGYKTMQPDSENTNKMINAANNLLIAC